MRSRSGGSVLLEVLIAITVLALAGSSAIAVAVESVRVAQVAREHEQQVRTASAFMDAVALWPRADLDRRLGRREQGRWILHVERAAPTLYMLRIDDAATATELLRTAVFRRDTEEVDQWR